VLSEIGAVITGSEKKGELSEANLFNLGEGGEKGGNTLLLMGKISLSAWLFRPVMRRREGIKYGKTGKKVGGRNSRFLEEERGPPYAIPPLEKGGTKEKGPTLGGAFIAV